MPHELSDDSVITTPLPINARLFGAVSASAPEPSSFGREAILNYITGELSPVATSGSASDLDSGTLPLGRLHARVADWANIGTYTQGQVFYFNGSNIVALDPGTSGYVLATQGAGANPIWVAGASGTFSGPGSATDNAIVRFDGTTGALAQNSTVTIADTTGDIAGTGFIKPASNDGGALGDGTHAFSDLFLATGGVINWANGDVTITHASDALTFAGATDGYTFTNGGAPEKPVIIASNGGTSTRWAHSNPNYVGSLGALSGTGSPYWSLHAEHSSTGNTLKNSAAGVKGMYAVYDGTTLDFIFNGVATASANFSSTVTALRIAATGAVTLGASSVLGTPASGTLTNCTGLPIASGVSGLGTGVATFLATPSSANLLAALTDKTGTGNNVFATSPTLTTPVLGVATATSINKVAVTAPATSATLTISDGGSLITSGGHSLTLTTTGATNVTLPASGTVLTTATGASLGANTFTALQTITQASANAGILASTGYSLTGSDATSMISLAGTWNTSGTPTALLLNITNTASNAASKLLDLQVGGASQFKVGPLATTATSGQFQEGYVSLFSTTSAAMASTLTARNVIIASSTSPQVLLNANGEFGFTASGAGTDVGVSPDVRLFRAAANIHAWRNSTSAQTGRYYATFTDASNGAWGFIDSAVTTAATLTIGTSGNGTGASTLSKFQVSLLGTNYLDYGVRNAGAWTFNDDVFFVDATYDIGSNGAGRPRDTWASRNVHANSNLIIDSSGGVLQWGNWGNIKPQSDGVWTFFNNASSGFSRLQLGGTTASFPALKRSTTRLQSVLADDSAFAGVDVANVGHQGVAFASLPGSPVAGMTAYVTDGNSTTWGATQTGGGSSKTLVWYNGTNWTVAGI